VTGLIYVVIIALWAAVLIPIWLRRHDQISEVRSTARFSSAMRSLGKDSLGKDSLGKNNAAPGNRARDVAARRRAIILGVLSAALAVTLVLAMVNLVPRWSPIVLAVLVLAYVIATAATSSRRVSSTATTTRRRRSSDSPERVSSSERADYDELLDDREIAYSDQVAEVAYPRTRGLRPPTRRSRDAQIAAAMDDFVSWDPWEAEESTAEDAWSAVPTTLPTYVNAPRATRVRRPIERDRDWSGEAMVEAARTMRRPRLTVDDLADDRYALSNTPAVTASDDTAELPTVRMDADYEQTRRAAGE
jgi:type IV secretory pathway VirB3-like protein